MVADACYDIGVTFRPKCFLNDGAPYLTIFINVTLFCVIPVLYLVHEIIHPVEVSCFYKFDCLGGASSSQNAEPHKKKMVHLYRSTRRLYAQSGVDYTDELLLRGDSHHPAKIHGQPELVEPR